MSLSQLPAKGEGGEEHGLQFQLPLLLQGVVILFEGVPGVRGEGAAAPSLETPPAERQREEKLGALTGTPEFEKASQLAA